MDSFETRLAGMLHSCAKRQHGTRARYRSGCHCEACRRANTQYEIARSKLRREGFGNGWVPAGRARRRLRALRRRGVGLRAISAATDIQRSSLQLILRGKKRHLRAATERRLLQCDSTIASDGSHVPAGRSWALLKALLDRGYTKTQLATWLGSKARIPQLQFGSRYIRASNALKIRKLYKSLEEGKLRRK